MTLFEALIEGTDFIRSSSEDPRLLVVAKVLERKAQKIRGRMETSPFRLDRCYCEARRLSSQILCPDCHSIMPMKLLVEFHTGKPAKRRRAEMQMRAVCDARVNVRTMAA